MRILLITAIVSSFFSCATPQGNCPVDCKGKAQDCTFLKDAEPSPGANRSNVPISVKDNTWYLQVPESFSEPIEIRYVEQPVTIVNVCTGKKLKCAYNKETETATIAKLPASNTPTVIAAKWYVAHWTEEFKAFDEQDRTQRPALGGTLFVGSSTVRGWKLDTYFPGLNAINRGFGGSQFIDSIHYAERLIIQYNPRTVVVYAGDNDMAEGHSPERVVANVEALFGKIQFHLPNTRIVIMSIKPSFDRWNVWPKMKLANELIEINVKSHTNVVYADIASALLGPDEQPRAEFYGEDGLHLTQEGYEAISAVLRPLLMPAK